MPTPNYRVPEIVFEPFPKKLPGNNRPDVIHTRLFSRSIKNTLFSVKISLPQTHGQSVCLSVSLILELLTLSLSFFLPVVSMCGLFIILNRFSHCFLKDWAIPGPFLFIFVFSTVNSNYVHYKILPMTGVEPRISFIRSDCSANWATTTTLLTPHPIVAICGLFSILNKLFSLFLKLHILPVFTCPTLYQCVHNYLLFFSHKIHISASTAYFISYFVFGPILSY